MTTLTTRTTNVAPVETGVTTVKGTALTNTEVDQNFLSIVASKAEASLTCLKAGNLSGLGNNTTALANIGAMPLAGGAFTGTVTMGAGITLDFGAQKITSVDMQATGTITALNVTVTGTLNATAATLQAANMIATGTFKGNFVSGDAANSTVFQGTGLWSYVCVIPPAGGLVNAAWRAYNSAPAIDQFVELHITASTAFIDSTNGSAPLGTSLPLSLRVTGVDYLHITTAGLVGIGAVAPAVKLQVGDGTAQFTARVTGAVAADKAPVLSLNRVGGHEWTASVSAAGGLQFGMDSAGFSDANYTAAVKFQMDVLGNFAIGAAPYTSRFLVSHATAGTPATSGTADTAVAMRLTVSNVSLDTGVYASGVCWMQGRLWGNLATNFSLALNPNGGSVVLGAATASALAAKLEVTGSIFMVGGATGRRFYFDGSDATLANRAYFQSSVTNGNTSLAVLPNGTSNTTNVRCMMNSDVTAAQQFMQLSQSGTVSIVDANVLNAGAQGTLELRIGGAAACAIDVNKNFIHKAALCDQSYSKQVPATGFSITPASNTSTLALDPAGTLATGTVTLPASTAAVDGQIIRVLTTQTITALTVNAGAGNSIKNAPSTLAAGAGFSYIYVVGNTTWYRLY